MKIEVNETGHICMKEVFNHVILESADGEKLVICMRDSGFELDYITKTKSVDFEAKNGKIRYHEPQQ